MLLHTVVFGGLVPKANPRALPDNAAQTATNLMSGSTEFRPMKTDTTVVASSGVTNPKGIYRLQRKSDGTLNTDFTSAATWKIDSLPTSYSRTQINGDTTERTIKTFDDGSAPARMIDAQGGDRRLGVPKPTTAPSVVVNVTDEFTNEERAGGIANILQYLKTSTDSLITPVWRGATRPGTGTNGYIDRDTVPGIDDEEAQQLRLFRFSSTGGSNNGALEDPYVGAAASFGWIQDAGLGGFWKTAAGSGWPAWAGTTKDHWAVPFHAYGLTYDINEAGLVAALEAIDMPGGDTGDKLLTEEQAEEIKDMVVEMSTQQWADVQPKINALVAKVTQAKVLLDGGTAAAQQTSLSSFYAQSAITTIVDDAFDNFAEAVWNEAVKAHAFTEYTPP